MEPSPLVKLPSDTRAWLTPSVRSLLRSWFSGPRGWIITGVVVIAAGMASGWSWLTAVGVAPIILSLAPCAAMCALGLCMMPRRGGGTSSCEKPGASDSAKLPDKPAN